MKTQEYDFVLLKGEMDTCKASKGIMGNFITKLIAQHLEQYSNYRFLCPQKKGFLYAYNFPMVTDKDLPTYLLPFRGKFAISGTFKAQVTKGKKLVELSSGTLFGERV